MKTQNPPKKKLPRKITPKKEKLYPDKWIVSSFDNYKIIKIKNKNEENKYAFYKIFTNYKKALLHKKKRIQMCIRITNKTIKAYHKNLNKLNGILLLTQEELKNTNS